MSVTQGFPGPYYSLNFKKRNVFGGLEIFDLNGRFGFEGVASATQVGNFYRSTEANVTASLTFPQFLIPLRPARAYRWGRYNPRTKLLAGYTYTDRPEYKRSITTYSTTFSWERGHKLQFTFSPTTLNVIRSDVSSGFQAVLDTLKSKGNNLINAFRPSFVGSMLFTVTYNPNNYGSNVNSFFVRASLESGGTLLNLYSPKFIEQWGLEPYQYARASLDIRRTQVINKHTLLAMRVNTGVGFSYSDNKVLPYEKNFFVGGSNSVRAWRPRRLGQGELPPRLSTNPNSNGFYDYSFEKPGDLLLEASIELRQKLFGFVNYALFLDAGNVWAITSNPDTRTQFNGERFYKQFGVGTGFGLRFDFTFLILRFDVGMKVFDPARPEGERFVLDRVRFTKPYGTTREPVIYNIGIGYPF
ncbi:MAG: BamA/TamA family outer membrane protein [Cyclobacteriaceae bacterium]